MSKWQCALELDSSRTITAGSEAELLGRIRGGADLRVYTEFYHDEHIDPNSANHEKIVEVSDFPLTYVLDNRWVAGMMTLRQPVSLPSNGFGPPSMSFFMYNQNGQQAIARPFLDGVIKQGEWGSSPLNDHSLMPKYHELDNWDAHTNGPSSNFIYDFETFRYYVQDRWKEVLSHTSDGEVVAGSIDDLQEAFANGYDVKVAIRNLCSDMTEDPESAMDHEVFIQLGPGYYYTDMKLFIAQSRPLVRVHPNIPLRYTSRNWEFGWVIPRTDGSVSRLMYDPYTLQYRESAGRHAIRWFVSA